MTIGFIGLGTMGGPMATNLQKAGHSLVVNDLARKVAQSHEANGAVWVATPTEVAQVCDVIFTSLPTPADVEAVGFGEKGLAKGFRKGAIWVDLSTNSVGVVRALHAKCRELGVDFLDGPISGGPTGAASGKLAIWIGGEKAAFDRSKPVLDAMADQARYVGPIGAGSIAKLTHNMAGMGIIAIISEVMTMGVKAGLDPLPLWDAIRQGAVGRSRPFDLVGRRLLQGKLDPPSFALKLAHKDVSLAIQLARDSGVPMDICEVVVRDMAKAMERGWGGQDAQSFGRLHQERAGVAPFALSDEEIDGVLNKG